MPHLASQTCLRDPELEYLLTAGLQEEPHAKQCPSPIAWREMPFCLEATGTPQSAYTPTGPPCRALVAQEGSERSSLT